jgi:uncharacterized protein (TIGR00369 family)
MPTAPDKSSLAVSIAAQLRSSFASQGALRCWDAQITRLAVGECEIALPISGAVTQQHGYFHGGVVGALADAAGGYAANTQLMPSHECLTAEYKINLVAPADGQLLIARGSVRKAGRTLVIASVDVFVVKDGVEKLCAIMQQTLFAIACRT